MTLRRERADVMSAGFFCVDRPAAQPTSAWSLIAFVVLLCVPSLIVGLARADDTCLDPSCRETVGPDTSVPQDPALLKRAPDTAPSGGEAIQEEPNGGDAPPSGGTDENRTPPTVGGRAG
jgi:hypothetical protein